MKKINSFRSLQFFLSAAALFILLLAFKLPAQPQLSESALTIHNPAKRMIMLAPAMLQKPGSHKIRLTETVQFSQPVFVLYNRFGVKVLEKRLDLIAPFDAIPLTKIFNRPVRLPMGYYFYELQPAYPPTPVFAADSLLFRDVSQTHLPPDSTLYGYTEFVDVNRDNFPDIVTGFFNFQRPCLLMNDGSGHFSDQTSQRFPQVQFITNDVAIVDIDQDGDDDIFFAALDTQLTTTSFDKLFLNDGRGFFTEVSATRLPRMPPGSQNVDAGFINNDAFPDLLISGVTGLDPARRTALFVLINDGQGRFTNQSSAYLPQSAYGVLDAALADVNGDARNDIVMANLEIIITDENDPNVIYIFNGQDAIFMQNSSNRFVDETAARMPTDPADGKLIKVTDINNDNAPELYVINLSFFFGGTPHTLYLNDGRGFFQNATASRLPQQDLIFINDVEFRDFDANGFVDMYIANVIPGAPARDFLNFNNNGFFREASQYLPERVDFSGSCSSADVEGDGDFDIFVSNGSGFSGKAPDLLLENLGTVTGVAEQPALLPQRFMLSQNHPNPFNPRTTIPFSLARAGYVILKVFNLSGEEIATLTAENLPAGEHRAIWDASGMAGGVYLFRLQAGSWAATRKLILLK